MKHSDARALSRALVEQAIARATRRKPGPRRRPDAPGEPAPADAPRSPTLSGGAAATMDA